MPEPLLTMFPAESTKYPSCTVAAAEAIQGKPVAKILASINILVVFIIITPE
jgi:hypothetical protein